MLILGICSHALPLRHDTVHKEQRSEQTPKRNLVSLHPLLLVIAPFFVYLPLWDERLGRDDDNLAN